MNVLIPDGESVFALWVVNCLSNHRRIQIHICSNRKWTETRFSNHISSFIHFPSKNSGLDKIEFLRRIIKEKNIDVLLPTGFHDIRLISKYKSIFKNDGLTIIVSSVRSLDIANCKWKLSEFLNKYDFPIPKTYHIQELNTSENYPFPMIVKPLSRWNGSGFKMIKKRADLADLVNNNGTKNIAQEYIKGVDFCVNVISHKGKVLAQTIQKGILPNSNEFKPNLGVKFQHNEKLTIQIGRIIEKLDWSGVVNFDIIYEEKKKIFYIIEMNPRFWGSVEASEKVGVNFPYLMCLLSTGTYFAIPEYKDENYVSNRGLVIILKQILLFKTKEIVKIQNSSIVYALKDPKPKIFKYLNKLKIYFTKLNIFDTSRRISKEVF